MLTEIFYRYDIDLEDDDSLDFEDLLKKALVIVRRGKFLADLLQDRETELAYKYAEPQEKISATPNDVEPLIYPAQNLAPLTQFHNTQVAVQEDIPVVRIHTWQTKEFKAGEMRSGANDCILISDPAKYFYENLAPLFVDFKPRDEEVGQFHVDSITVFEPFNDTTGFERHAHKPDSSSKESPWKFLNSLSTGIRTRRKAGMISEKEPAGFDGIVV